MKAVGVFRFVVFELRVQTYTELEWRFQFDRPSAFETIANIGYQNGKASIFHNSSDGYVLCLTINRGCLDRMEL